MIILDTNVVSEPIRPRPNANVLNWIDQNSAQSLFFTSTGLAELLFGVEILPDGKRKKDMAEGMSDIVKTLFGRRILHFDEMTARIYSRIVAKARARGISIAVADGQIAAIALANNFAVATRDTLPFEAAGVKVINPWIAG